MRTAGDGQGFHPKVTPTAAAPTQHLAFTHPHLLQTLLGIQAPSDAKDTVMAKTLSWASESLREGNTTVPKSQRRWH